MRVCVYMCMLMTRYASGRAYDMKIHCSYQEITFQDKTAKMRPI